VLTKKEQYRVYTNEDFEDMPEGSSILVEIETDKFLYGTWSSREGTYDVRVPRTICERRDSLNSIK